MTTTQTFTKEATYEGTFNGIALSLDMYIDDVTKRRYYIDPSKYPFFQYQPTNFLGTENAYDTYDLEYISELYTEEDYGTEGYKWWRVQYRLSDVGEYIFVTIGDNMYGTSSPWIQSINVLQSF